jgi:hypothetical protein
VKGPMKLGSSFLDGRLARAAAEAEMCSVLKRTLSPTAKGWGVDYDPHTVVVVVGHGQ